MTKHIEERKFRLGNVGEDKYLSDEEYEDSSSFESPKNWAVFAYKVYQGANEILLRTRYRLF